MPQSTRDQIFISYSHNDRHWLEDLQTMLKPLVHKQSISVWDDTKTKAGAKWKEEIEDALALAKVAVLLVSRHFLASDFIAEHELPPILDAAKKQGLVILWIYVSSCLYDETEIKDYQAAHDISKPLDSLTPSKQRSVLADVCRKIKAAAIPVGPAQEDLPDAADPQYAPFTQQVPRVTHHANPGHSPGVGAVGYQSSSISFDWVTIPAGYFWMGSDRHQDSLAAANEEMQRLYLPEYMIACVPVTVAQFRRYVTAMHPRTTAEVKGGAHDCDPTSSADHWPKKDGAYWEHPHGPGSEVEEDHPVTCISWDDALAFCAWAKVRLPTEAEWEKAARGTDARIYPWGNEPPDQNRCNFAMNVGDTTPVPTPDNGKPAKYPPGANGLYDMAGNVWEWTSSIHRASRYDASHGREDPKAKGERVLRGGSFYQDSRNVRCANRQWCHSPDATVSDFGFRVCALELQSK
jgi:sulfatase modifying factor 1